MTISEATNQQEWDTFLSQQQFRPFLQSWTMGEVYKAVGQQPIRLEIRDKEELIGICQAIVVPARRGRHLAISYGPLINFQFSIFNFQLLADELKKIAKEHNCSFIRMSPLTPATNQLEIPGAKPSPLHLLAEHIWYIPLTDSHDWKLGTKHLEPGTIFSNMRKNRRNLIRRAEKEGVIVERSKDPLGDLPLFLELHEETRKRHNFTPYTDAFFRAQVELFAARNECTLYIARYNNEVVATSVHMHMHGETSYHHGASTTKYPKIPASYLLQWTAIQDALERKDHVYNFWGIAPEGAKKHPFAGVTTFKTGFGGQLLELQHCMDIPVEPQYYVTRGFEFVRKWRRGF